MGKLGTFQEDLKTAIVDETATLAEFVAGNVILIQGLAAPRARTWALSWIMPRP